VSARPATRVARILRAAAIFSAATVVTLAQLQLPSKKLWDKSSVALYAAVVVLALLATQDAAKLAGQTLQSGRLRRYERDVRAILSTGLAKAVSSSTIPWDSVGVHAFLLHGLWPWRRLVNVGGIRLGVRPSMAGPTWTPGKGVVGVAFKHKVFLAEDWGTVMVRANALGPARWRALPSVNRYGLSWGELQLTSDYVGICACPIYATSGKAIGCVSLDAPLTATKLSEPAVQVILRDVATGVCASGKPPRAWYYDG